MLAMAEILTLLNRPRPPEDLIDMTGLIAPDTFVPAPELLSWIQTAYLEAEGPLHTPDHVHLLQAKIGVLWTNAENNRAMRRIVGQAEMPSRVLGRLGKWQRGRAEQQLMEWFGYLPDFLLTFDAVHAEQCDNASFAALVDHELFHCAQQLDEFGMPKFHRDTGDPMFTIRGHEVEEFIGVVRRFGIQAAGEAATEMVIAAAQRPDIAPAKLAQACGTCQRSAA